MPTSLSSQTSQSYHFTHARFCGIRIPGKCQTANGIHEKKRSGWHAFWDSISDRFYRPKRRVSQPRWQNYWPKGSSVNPGDGADIWRDRPSQRGSQPRWQHYWPKGSSVNP